MKNCRNQIVSCKFQTKSYGKAVIMGTMGTLMTLGTLVTLVTMGTMLIMAKINLLEFSILHSKSIILNS
ncbi:hypothetical protein DMZ48_09125 [Robertkochia solimangrovi]|nr:hypothetical protein DMZ48_09125 [Robertkochia solimangrovi]